MRFKAPTFEISSDDPFKHDLLARKESAEILAQFVESLTEPFVLAIDSPWGTGKTVFLRMWVQMLRNQGKCCLYFNAWENDFSDSPLVSLIGEIGTSIENFGISLESKNVAMKAFEKTKQIGAGLVKAALPAALKLATAGMLDVGDTFKTTLADLAEEIAKKEIEKYQSDKITIQHFRESLSELVLTLAKEKPGTTQGPVIFVIDELDRCRPDYAIQLLEKMKHLFSVEGLVFVLAVDKDQLGECVKSLYGTGLNADGYLRRFIDMEYRLPTPEMGQFVDALFGKYGLNEVFAGKVYETQYDRQLLGEILKKLFPIFDFSLRIQEQCFTQIALVMRTTPPNAYLYGTMLGLLICLRVAKRQLYLDYVRGFASASDVLTYLRSLLGGEELVDSRDGVFIEAELVFGMTNTRSAQEAVKQYETLAKSEGKDEILKQRATMVLKHMQYLGGHSMFGGNLTDYLYRKIEVTRRFIPADPKA